MRLVIRLIIIFLFLYVGVVFFYAQLEKKMTTTADQPLPKNDQKQMVHHARGKAGTEQGAEAPANGTTGVSYTEVIVKRNLFGASLDGKKVRYEDTKEEEHGEELNETTLDLALQGTVAGNREDARAIIVDRRENRQEIYRIGDSVQGAQITDIQRGKVILKLKGRKEVLLLEERKAGEREQDPATVSQRRGVRLPATVVPATGTAGSRAARTRIPSVVPHRRITFRREKMEPEEPLEPELQSGDVLSEEEMEEVGPEETAPEESQP